MQLTAQKDVGSAVKGADANGEEIPTVPSKRASPDLHLPILADSSSLPRSMVHLRVRNRHFSESRVPSRHHQNAISPTRPMGGHPDAAGARQPQSTQT